MFDLWLSEIVRKMIFLLFVVALDTLSGVVSALKTGEFKWEQLPKFISKYIPLIAGWLLAEAGSLIPEDIYSTANLPIPYAAFTAVGGISYGFVMAGGLGSFVANLANVGILKEWLEKVGFRKSE